MLSSCATNSMVAPNGPKPNVMRYTSLEQKFGSDTTIANDTELDVDMDMEESDTELEEVYDDDEREYKRRRITIVSRTPCSVDT